MFRRKSPDAEVSAPAPETAAAAQGKGAPTPTRKDAEAARKARLAGTTGNPKADKKAAREADRQARYEARLALQSGDERKLPARDSGPVRSYVRDFVDGRISAGELFIPVALVVLVAGFIRIQWVQVILLWAWSAMLLGVILDSFYLWYRLRKTLPERFPDESRRGTLSYGILRSLQIRKLRLPPPKVRFNGQPVVPKTKKQ